MSTGNKEVTFEHHYYSNCGRDRRTDDALESRNSYAMSPVVCT